MEAVFFDEASKGREALPRIACVEFDRLFGYLKQTVLPRRHPRLLRAAAPRFYIACAPRRLTPRMLRLRAVPSSTVLSLRTIASQKYGAALRRARVEGSKTCVSLKSRLESSKEERRKLSCISWLSFLRISKYTR